MASGSILQLQDGCQFHLDNSFHGFQTFRHATTTLNTTHPQHKKKRNPGQISGGQPFLNMELRHLRILSMLRSLMLSMATPCRKNLTKRKLLLSYLSAVLTSAQWIANQVQIFCLLS